MRERLQNTDDGRQTTDDGKQLPGWLCRFVGTANSRRVSDLSIWGCGQVKSKNLSSVVCRPSSIMYFLSLMLLFCFLNNSSFAGTKNILFPESGKDPINEATAVSGTSEIVNRITAEQIDAFYHKRHKTDGFNGCVLVSKDGKAIYSGAFGYGNIAQRDTLTPQSSFQLASVTKTFTSAAILKLAEEGKISLDDSIQKFFPEFPYKGISIKLLLSHRSGLPDYIYWDKYFIGPDINYLTNQSVLDLLIAKKPGVRCPPDRVFIYSNTNYALLALIIEKASGVSYKAYMQDNFFTPLSMNNTFVCTLQDTAINCGATCYEARKWREWKLSYSDGVVGDKGIYSSVEDMLKWDNALKEGKVISLEMLAEAYKPHNLDRYSFARDRSRNYGYGWRIQKQRNGGYLIYHNGNWHGCNNVFARNLKEGYTLIVLGNKENEANYQTQPVWNIIEKMKCSENNMAVSTGE